MIFLFVKVLLDVDVFLCPAALECERVAEDGDVKVDAAGTAPLPRGTRCPPYWGPPRRAGSEMRGRSRSPPPSRFWPLLLLNKKTTMAAAASCALPRFRRQRLIVEHVRNVQDADTPRAMINAGLQLGLACPVCPHRVVFPLEKLAHDPRPVWRLPFRCQCGEQKTFRYVLSNEQDIKDFEAGQHPKGASHHQR